MYEMPVGVYTRIGMPTGDAARAYAIHSNQRLVSSAVFLSICYDKRFRDRVLCSQTAAPPQKATTVSSGLQNEMRSLCVGSRVPSTSYWFSMVRLAAAAAERSGTTCPWRPAGRVSGGGGKEGDPRSLRGPPDRLNAASGTYTLREAPGNGRPRPIYSSGGGGARIATRRR